ncbi:MAG: polymorphic toxin-type HINT domain-containing protein [Planctomycetota bacterium]
MDRPSPASRLIHLAAAGCFLVAALFAGRAIWKSTRPAQPPAVAATTASLETVASDVGYCKIQNVRLGQRVVGTNPLRDEVDHTLLEPDRATWRELTLTMTKPDGKRLDIGLLRPAGWVAKRGAAAGATIHLDLEELGAKGPAEVLAVGPCPPIEPGAGEVVTGTFAHEASHQVLDVRIGGEAEPIGVTSNHPFWSVDRQGFVPAGELTVGETLDTLAGHTMVMSISARGPPEPVYNLEVHSEHVYRVAKSGVLVHNTCNVGFHGTSASNVLSIIRDGSLRPGKSEKIFLSEVNDVFGHGLEEISTAAYSLELEYLAGEADILFTPLAGNPRSIVISSAAPVPVNVKRLFIRTPNGDGTFSTRVIEGVADIVRELIR